MLGHDMWNYRPTSADEETIDRVDATTRTTTDLTGFGVEAIDGSIGKVDAASYETDSSSIVVDTGPWIFGKKVLLPAGVIDRIDPDDEKVYVHRSKDEIKGAPEYDELLANDETYRSDVGAYYGPEGRGFRERDDAPRQW